MLRVGYVYYPESAEIETGATRSNVNSYSLVPDIEEEIEREVKRLICTRKTRPSPAVSEPSTSSENRLIFLKKKQKTDL